MKRFIGAAALCTALALCVTSPGSTGVMRTDVLNWRTHKTNADGIASFFDSAYVSVALVNTSDTTAAHSLDDVEYLPGIANVDTAYSFFQFGLIPKQNSAVTVASDTLYVTPQISFGEATWQNFTSVPTLVVLEQGTANTFVVKLNQSTVNTPGLKAGIMGARAIRFIIQTSDDSPFGQYVATLTYPRRL